MAAEPKATSAKGRQAGGYQPPILAEPKGGPVPGSKPVAAADKPQRPVDPALAALLAVWPTLAAPLVTDLTKSATKAGTDVGALGTLTASKRAVTTVAGKLAPELAKATDATAAETVADAQRQGADTTQPPVDQDRVRQVATAAVGLIALAYAGAAARQALLAGPDGVADALAAMGAAATGVVADHLGAALHAARNAGRLAVYRAHPPRRYVADESGDAANRCAPCAEVDQKTYDDLAHALVDYAGFGGYVHCAGGLRCRGHLRAEWT